MGRRRLPKDGVIKLRNDPGALGKQLAFTLMGLLSVVGLMIAAIYTHGDAIDADIDKDAALGFDDAPQEGPDLAGPVQSDEDDPLVEAPLVGNVTAP